MRSITVGPNMLVATRNHPMPDSRLGSSAARYAVQALRASRIREVANAGMDGPDVLAFWFGEPDEVTPEFIRRRAVDASWRRGHVLHAESRHPGAARARSPPMSPGCTAPRCGSGSRSQFGHVGADGRDAGAGGSGRPRGGSDAAVAEPGRDPEDPRRHKCNASRCASRRRDGGSISIDFSRRSRRARARSTSTRPTTRRAGR